MARGTKPDKPKTKKVADNIYLLSDKTRTKPYRVHIFYKGKQYVKMCRTLSEAKEWRTETWKYIEKPKELQEIAKMAGTTVEFLVMKYSNYRDEKGELLADDFLFVTSFCRLAIAKKSIYDFDRKDANTYIQKRLSDTYIRKGWKEAKPVLPSTVHREVTTLKALWNAARNKGDYPKLDNPWTGWDDLIPGWRRIRTRTLEPGELERLLEASRKCRGFNQIYVPLAIHICLGTALRRQEIFNLRWDDIDFEDRTIRIRQSKTDKENAKKGLPPGRWIVLPFEASLCLLPLKVHHMQEYNKKLTECLDRVEKGLKPGNKPVLSDRVFPLTIDGGDPKYAFKQVWQDLRTRAGIQEIDGEMLEFKDLRKAARRKFEEADLTDTEANMQMGHAFEGMSEVYLDKEARKIKLRKIRNKLDRLVLGGHTLEELQEKENAMTQEERDNLSRKGMALYIKYLQEKGGDITLWDKVIAAPPPQWRNLLSVVQPELREA